VDLSLSIVLPVHNAEKTLVGTVHRLLELAPDITPRFELLIVDDASTDQTEEIAHDLSLEYPQVRITRHHRRQGRAAAVHTALNHCTGDVIFVQEEGTEIRSTELQRLWAMRHDHELVMARAEMPRERPSPHLLQHVAGWDEQLRNAPNNPRGGIQMIRRAAITELERSGPAMHKLRLCNIGGPGCLGETEAESVEPVTPVTTDDQAH
jgi:glycosyltransferase involved in cell wall biosynthesis